MKNLKLIIALVSLSLLIMACSTTANPTGDVVGDTSNVIANDVATGATDINAGSDQLVAISSAGGKYYPNPIVVKAGQPVTLVDDGLVGCSKSLIQSELGIKANFYSNNQYTFTPIKKGTYTITCSMGMYRGIMQVI